MVSRYGHFSNCRIGHGGLRFSDYFTPPKTTHGHITNHDGWHHHFYHYAAANYCSISIFRDLSSQANVNMVYMGTILKIVGVAYIADFGSQICRDAGEGALASKIEFAAKIIVLVMAVPIIVAVLQSLLKLVP